MSEEIINKLITVKEYHNRTKASQTTMENNAKMFLKISKTANKENFYYDVAFVKDLLKNYSVSTQLNYITIFMQLLEYDKIKLNKNPIKQLEEYKKLADTLRTQKKSNSYNNIASNEKKQAVLNLTMKDINKTLNDLKKDGYFRDALIIEFLLEFPCRMEASNLKYIKLGEYTKLKRKDELGDDNYVVIGSKKSYVSRGSYKTANTHGRLELELLPPLKTKIFKWIKDNNIQFGESVFGLSPAELAKRLHYITAKYNDGVSISTNIICKLGATQKVVDAVGGDNEIYEKIEKVNKAMEEVGKVRGTSQAIINNNYIIRKQPTLVVKKE